MTALPDPDLCSLSALEMARLVRSGQISPVELTQAHLDRIAQQDPQLRAFQLVRHDQALSEAAALANRADLVDLPLAGVPVAIKDNISVAGEPTRMGSAATPQAPADADDELVARLRAAGCVVIGKTQMPELAIWPFTEPAAFAPTRNPWDPSRSPGGSTGGGATAVASGMAALALGSDGGGSIRVPASCCGTFGLKPGPGLVPVAGGRSEHWCGLTAFGPISRTVTDAATALDVLSGTARHADRRLPERPLRIAISDKHPLPGAKASPRVSAALEEAGAILRNVGHSLLSQAPPYPATLGLRFNSRWLAGIAQDARELDFAALEPRTQQMVKSSRLLARKGRPVSDDSYGKRMAAWFADFDVLITPTLAGSPDPIGRWDGKGWFATMLGVANSIYTPPWNLAGLPAASVPFGQHEDGLPIGIQLVGPAGSEGTLLSLAIQIEHLRPWPQIATRPVSG
ncbi:MAG TPA: amidase family protein [Streptosporangiaceae bacterium]|nr:amidase family protein [Streptosporangiaceae bacterium]